MDLPGIITAAASLVTSLGILIPILRRTRKEVAGVHEIVNQQRTDMQLYNKALADALRAHGIDVPADKSLPDPAASPPG